MMSLSAPPQRRVLQVNNTKTTIDLCKYLSSNINTAPVGPSGGSGIATMTTSRPPTPDSFNNTTAIVGGVVAVLFIIVTAVTILVIVALVLRNRKAVFKPSQR